MNSEELNTALYKKMFESQERYRSWLLDQTPAEVLNHAYEYVTREDILLSAESNDLPEEKTRALLSSRDPLADVFKDFERIETGYMEDIHDCIESRADAVIRQQREADRMPLYRHSAEYAREHGELDQYRASHKANITCKEAIENAISESYRDNQLDTSCVDGIIDRFGMDRTAYVLAVTVQIKDWDERFSRQNKEWAKPYKIYESEDSRYYLAVDRPHSGLTDLFITAFRKEQVKQLETPKRMSIYEQLRQPVPQAAISARKPSQSMER